MLAAQSRMVQSVNELLDEANVLFNHLKEIDLDDYTDKCIEIYKKYRLIKQRILDQLILDANSQAQLIFCEFSMLSCLIKSNAPSLDEAIKKLNDIRKIYLSHGMNVKPIKEHLAFLSHPSNKSTHDYNHAYFLLYYIDSTDIAVQEDFLQLPHHPSIRQKISKLVKATNLLVDEHPQTLDLKAKLNEKIADFYMDLALNSSQNECLQLLNKADEYYISAIAYINSSQGKVSIDLHFSRLHIQEKLVEYDPKNKPQYLKNITDYIKLNQLVTLIEAMMDEEAKSQAIIELNEYKDFCKTVSPLPLRKRAVEVDAAQQSIAKQSTFFKVKNKKNVALKDDFKKILTHLIDAVPGKTTFMAEWFYAMARHYSFIDKPLPQYHELVNSLLLDALSFRPNHTAAKSYYARLKDDAYPSLEAANALDVPVKIDYYLEALEKIAKENFLGEVISLLYLLASLQFIKDLPPQIADEAERHIRDGLELLTPKYPLDNPSCYA